MICRNIDDLITSRSRVSDSTNDDFLFLGEEEEDPSSSSVEPKKSDKIKNKDEENNAILINKNDKVNFNDFANCPKVKLVPPNSNA